MVVGHGFESRLHLKARWKNDGPLDGRKYNKINKDSQIRQVRAKKIKFFKAPFKALENSESKKRDVSEFHVEGRFLRNGKNSKKSANQNKSRARPLRLHFFSGINPMNINFSLNKINYM